MLQDPVLTKIAEKKAKSPAQVVLRWLDLKEVVPLPKSNSQERIKQNFDVGWASKWALKRFFSVFFRNVQLIR